jgi:hypothetical protein
MVADALIYHPTVSHYLKFVATTGTLISSIPSHPIPSHAHPSNAPPVGRDKVLRTLQYFSRFLAWYLYRTNRPASTIAPYDAVKKQFGATRKLMRVGKFVEHFRAAAVASDAKSMDPIVKMLTVGRQLGYAAYMLADSVCVVCLFSSNQSLHAEISNKLNLKTTMY